MTRQKKHSARRIFGSQLRYRYHPDARAGFPDWDDDWLASADNGWAVFILSRVCGVVVHANHGAGRWEAEQMFGSLPEMLPTFGVIADVVESAGHLLTDAAAPTDQQASAFD
jgi:hypothetical protein